MRKSIAFYLGSALAMAAIWVGRMCWSSITFVYRKFDTWVLTPVKTAMAKLFAPTVMPDLGARLRGSAASITLKSNRERSAGLPLGAFMHRTSLCM